MTDEKRKQFLKIYNSIFTDEYSYVEALIKAKGFNFECVDFICRELNFMYKRCKESEWYFKALTHYSETKQLNEIVKGLENATSEEEKQQLNAKLDELRPIFDVSNEENVVAARDLLYDFLMLRRELEAIEQINGNLVDVTQPASWSDVAKVTKSNAKMSVVEATLWTKQIVNAYFANLGLTKKPQISFSSEANSELFNLEDNGAKKTCIIIDENLVIALASSRSKREFAGNVIKQCAYAYMQIAVSNPSYYRGKHVQAAMMGAALIDSKIGKFEEDDSISDFVEHEADRMINKSTAKMIVLPNMKQKHHMLFNHLATQVIAEFNKQNKKKPQ